MTTAVTPTAHTAAHAKENTKRLSLQPPAGLPQLPRSPGPLSARFATRHHTAQAQVGKGHTRHASEPVSAPYQSTSQAGVGGHGEKSGGNEFATRRESDVSDTSISTSSDDLPDENTLMGCMMHLSVSSLPPITCAEDGTFHDGSEPAGAGSGTKVLGGPLMTRFPLPPKAQPSSALGTREEQRKVYLGPKLSDRATGGPDAGPLIERFSCLFKDRTSFPLYP